jgi:molecular chaperone DnaJ
VAEVLIEHGARRPAAARGADLHQLAAITFAESFTGCERPLTLTRRETCRTCRGAGVERTPAGPCAVCQGQGAVRTVRGHMVFARSCNSCGGTGQQPPRACPAARAPGHEVRAERVTVRLPAGVSDGERVRVAGKGDAGPRGGPAGDLYVTVQVAADQDFRREGDDLHVVVPVGVHEAALGARVEIAGLDGPVKVRIPPGTQSGQRFPHQRAGHGVARGGPRGDLVVEARLMLPPCWTSAPRHCCVSSARSTARAACAAGRGVGELTMAKKTERGKAYFMISARVAEVRHPSDRRCAYTSARVC